MTSRFSLTCISVASVAVGFVAWELVHASGVISAELVPGPARVLATFADLVRNGYRGTSLGANVAATLGRCVAGFVAACVAGIPLGLWMGTNARAAAAFDYIVQFMRPLPPLAYLVLLILWFGTGDRSKIALLFLTAFPIVVTSAMAGVRTVREQHLQAARSLGATRAQVLRYVILPGALPAVVTGARIALAAAFSAVVAAELMTATNGLGWMIFSASQFLRNDIVIAGIFMLGVLGLALNQLMLAVDRAVIHWRGIE